MAVRIVHLFEIIQIEHEQRKFGALAASTHELLIEACLEVAVMEQVGERIAVGAILGFAEELRALLMRAAERGLDGRALRQFGRRSGRDDWVAAGAFPLGRCTNLRLCD